MASSSRPKPIEMLTATSASITTSGSGRIITLMISTAPNASTMSL
jgi:hypothetical protein